MREVNRYKTRDITSSTFSDPARWYILKDIMVYHTSPITRHEACFVAAEVGCDCAGSLVSIVKFDTSVVNKHEAAEALGKLRDRSDACMAYAFLKKASGKLFF